jgi:hypothetical protein
VAKRLGIAFFLTIQEHIPRECRDFVEEKLFREKRKPHAHVSHVQDELPPVHRTLENIAELIPHLQRKRCS